MAGMDGVTMLLIYMRLKLPFVPSAKAIRQCSRFNHLGIQMLSKSIHEQLFQTVKQEALNPKQETAVKQHLKTHGLWGKSTDRNPELDIKLPSLQGKNIEEHITNITLKQSKPYIELADILAEADPPILPSRFAECAGWHRYDADGSATPVPFPDEPCMVLDVETLVNGNYPMMAVVLSRHHCYTWMSKRLEKDMFIHTLRSPRMNELIPMGVTERPSLVLGHNVGYDRSYISEQYRISRSGMRFLDTMSMHVALSGFTSFQRLLYTAKKKGTSTAMLKKKKQQEGRKPRVSEFEAFDWMDVGSLNNLRDVFQLHCGGEPIDKELRNVFVEGTVSEIREKYQELMLYCANDTLATLQVYRSLWPVFRQHFPSPVTFAGMLEMGTAYLPVNSTWKRYTDLCDQHYNDLQSEMSHTLSSIAADVCATCGHKEAYRRDPWVFDLDWSKADFKLLKNPRKPKKDEEVKEADVSHLHPVVQSVLQSANRLPKVIPHMPGVPNWYRELHPRLSDPEWRPGASLITTSRRVTPKLLRLTWEGYPLYYHEKYGWGYVVPYKDELDKLTELEPTAASYPYREARDVAYLSVSEQEFVNVEQDLSKWLGGNIEKYSLTYPQAQKIWKDIGVLTENQKELFRRSIRIDESGPSWHQGIGPIKGADIQGGWFYKLPHKNGENNNVGNPLSQDFMLKIEDGTLSSAGGANAKRVLEISKICSYWKNNRDRIRGQMVMWLNPSDLPDQLKRHESYNPRSLYGAILPRIVTAGTVTRRAVEKTWLTASNARPDRLGSELKSVVQAPPGYHFVGADVDSQELWIASLLGDAQFAKTHGSTALGWMTLQGKKTEGTDLHSKTAQLIGISRNEAKIFNYARIYGAGKTFTQKLLMQFDPKLSMAEAQHKTNIMYKATKGVKKRQAGSLDATKVWMGGSESAAFNRLEQIATSPDPRTPVLRCRISTALLPENVHQDFMTSRINWVVQSSAVDYLHLLLVSMRWLLDEFNISGRFCISIHDEVRYLVKSEDRYRAALALHLSNLYVRTLFSYKVGIYDLPQSVAFFSGVDIDRCLRKEVNEDCITPSNIHGLSRSYNIPYGESLDIYQILKLTGGSLIQTPQAGESTLSRAEISK